MVVIVQNDREVPPGTYGDYLDRRGISWQLVACCGGEALPPAEATGAAILLGGAMGVHETERFPFLVEEQRFIRDCVQLRVPLLGICLGGQLLAATLGGEVTANRWGERGTLPVQLTGAGRSDPLFAGISDPFTTFQWHNDSFAIPPEGVLLASSAACPHQAFRFAANAYGLQFHPEVTAAIVADWCRGGAAPPEERARLAAEFSAAAPAYSLASDRLLANFLEIAGLG